MAIKRKGQFYIIASVFVFMALSALFAFTLFVEFGSQTLPSQSLAEFQNLENAIQQRNNWLPTYWFDLNCKNKTVANITSYNNPLEFDAGITISNQPIYVFRLNGKTRTQIATYYLTMSNNVTFNATGSSLYEIFWNCPSGMGPWPTLEGNEISPPKYLAEAPGEGICSHFNSILPKKNIAFNCSSVNNTNTYNYSISFTATDFAYVGSMR